MTQKPFPYRLSTSSCSIQRAVSAAKAYTGYLEGFSVQDSGTLNLYVPISFDSKKAWDAYLSQNPMEYFYILAEPIRTPLTTEEIAEIEKLHTFNPVTNISNDSDCGMSVTYLVDSKIYIDNKIASQMDALRAELTNMFALMPTETQATMIENDVNNLLTESEG